MGTGRNSSLEPAAQRDFAIQLVRRLTEAGYQAVLAGGCVRDQLLGRRPDDYDVATSATPEQVRQVFGHRRTLAIGAAFGVIAVLGPKSAGTVEVATFRRDETYSDGRHPDAVQFSSAAEDAQRRDFTINGLFYDPLQNQVLDYVGGLQDLQRQVVRAIGQPAARFQEDHLRMLRAIRFSVRLGFQLDPDTLHAIQQLAPRIVDVSAERVAQELRLLWSHPHSAQALEMLQTSGLLPHLWPELGVVARLAGSRPTPDTIREPHPPESDELPWTVAPRVLARLQDPQLPLVVALLAHHALRVSADQAEAVASQLAGRWRLPRDESDRIRWYLAHHDLLIDAPERPWPQVQRTLIDPRAPELLHWCQAELETFGRPLHPVQFCRERLQWPQERLNPPPLITGQDLLDRQIPRGPWYKQILDQIRDEQLIGELSDRSAAIERIDQLWQRTLALRGTSEPN